LIGKEVSQTLKIEQFELIKQGLMTVDGSQSLLKKAENRIKREI
jgi:hypothetical protein